ncbi:MAG: hypothetical protein K0Q49_1286 [Haloplasmataceae bacterium]|jgi:hypothetical protein|nr:hypothetical protein [Haloplasmataceae bacterium]
MFHLKGISFLLISFTLLLLSGCEILEVISKTEQTITSNASVVVPQYTTQTGVTSAPDPSLVIRATFDNMENLLNYQNKVVINDKSSLGDHIVEFSYMFDLDQKDEEQDRFTNYNRKYGLNRIDLYDDFELDTIYLELIDEKRLLYTKNNEKWHVQDVYKEILNELYYGALVNFNYNYLANQEATLIESDHFDVYEINIDGSEMLLSALQTNLTSFLSKYKITNKEFEDLLVETKLIVTIFSDTKEIVFIDVDFTSILNDLFDLAKPRVTFELPTYTQFTINNSFGNTNGIDLEITDEMRSSFVIPDHSVIFSETLNNMTHAYNYENKMIYDISSESGSSYSYLHYAIDMENASEGLIRHTSSGSQYYLEDNQTLYTYINQTNEWIVNLINEDDFEHSPSHFITNKELFSFLNDTEFVNVYQVNNNLVTYVFDGDMNEMLFIAFNANKDVYLNYYKVTEEELSRLFVDFKFFVTIDTTTHLITKIEMDFSDVLSGVYDLAKDRDVSHLPTGVSSKFTIWYGKYNEIELFINDDMKNIE